MSLPDARAFGHTGAEPEAGPHSARTALPSAAGFGPEPRPSDLDDRRDDDRRAGGPIGIAAGGIIGGAIGGIAGSKFGESVGNAINKGWHKLFG